MKKLLWIGVLSLLMMPLLARAEVEVVVAERSTAEALFINLRTKYDETRGWLLKGRVSRAAKNNKVPDGFIFARFENAKGELIGSLSGEYKPMFVHRKTDRASYFTIEVPGNLMQDAAVIRVFHRTEQDKQPAP